MQDMSVKAFDPGASVSINDEYKLSEPTGETRRYPCPECTKPRIPPDRRGYSTIRANKLVDEKFARNEQYLESVRGNVAALIGRNLLVNGLVDMIQYRAPPGVQGMESIVIEGVISVVHPEGREIDRVIQDLDPNLYFGERQYQPEPRQRPRPKLMSGDVVPWDAVPGRTPEPTSRRPEPRRKNLRELIFDDEVPPDAEG